MPFRDRADAGRRLAERLLRCTLEEPIVVVGLPRGGVPVAAEVARALHVPLDVLVVRKLGCPWQPELAMGAVGEGGVIVLDRALIAKLGLRSEAVGEVIRRERAELGAACAPLPGGSSAGGGREPHRGRGRRRAGDGLRAIADEVVAVETPVRFVAIGQFYADFGQTSDEEVVRLLVAPKELPAPAAAAGDPVRSCDIDLGPVRLAGELAVPASPAGVVVFAHRSGSGRHSPRNRFVAAMLNQAGLATLLLDLLTPEEELVRANVFDIGLLSARLVGATRWLRGQREVADLPVGYFGASTVPRRRCERRPTSARRSRRSCPVAADRIWPAGGWARCGRRRC